MAHGGVVVDICSQVQIGKHKTGQVQRESDAWKVFFNILIRTIINAEDNADILDRSKSDFIAGNLAETEVCIPLQIGIAIIKIRYCNVSYRILEILYSECFLITGLTDDDETDETEETN